MINIYFYSQPKAGINPVSYFDHEIDYFLKHNFKHNIDCEIYTYQILIIYALRAQVALGNIQASSFKLFMDDKHIVINENGRFANFITYDDKFETSIDTILNNSDKQTIISNKIIELKTQLLNKGCYIEKRPNGYMGIANKDRKFIFNVTADKLDFYCEIVHAKNEKFIAQINNLLKMPNDHIVNLILEFLG